MGGILDSGQRFQRIKKLLLAVLGFAGVILVLTGTSSYGPGISHDSAAYIFAAKSLLAGKGYEYFGYVSPFMQWPPLFPTLLALAAAAGIDPVIASRYINAIVFGLIIYLTGIWLDRHMRSYLFALLGAAAALLSLPLIYASEYIWTEPLFILLFIIFLFKFEDYVLERKSSSLIMASAAVALASLDRYMGVTIIFTGCLFLMVQKKAFIKRIIDILLFGTISSLPTVIWIVRNYIVSSTLVGLRTPATVTLKQNIIRTAKTVVNWLLPYKSLANKFVMLQLVAIVLVIVILLVITVIMSGKRSGIKRNDDTGPLFENGLQTAFLFTFVVFYSIYMIASATAVAFDAIGDRYLLPIYIPMVLFALLVLDGFVRAAKKHGYGNILAIALSAVLCLWFVYPLSSTMTAAESRRENGLPNSYNSSFWRKSELISYLGSNPVEYGVYSNYPDAIYILTGIEAKYTPKKSGLPQFYGYNRFSETVKSDKGAYIIWFDRGAAATIYNPNELRRSFNVELVKKVKDGTVYFIRP